jgi:hypothetical protein
MVDTLDAVLDEENVDVAIHFKTKDERYSKLLSWEEIEPIKKIYEIVEVDDSKGYRITDFLTKTGKITYEERYRLNGEAI